MLQAVPGDKGKFIVSNLFNAVPYDALDPLPPLDEVEFELLMGMDGIQELAFVPFHNVKTVFVRDGRDFTQNFRHFFAGLLHKDRVFLILFQHYFFFCRILATFEETTQ